MSKLDYQGKAKLYGELASIELNIAQTERGLKTLKGRKREIRISLGDLKPSWSRDPMSDKIRPEIESILEAVSKPLMYEDVVKQVCAAVPGAVPGQISHHLRILSKDKESGVRHNGHRGHHSAYYFRAPVEDSA